MASEPVLWPPPPPVVTGKSFHQTLTEMRAILELHLLKHETTVYNYAKQFEEILPYALISKSRAINLFILGLQPDIRKVVQDFNPNSLDIAISRAYLHEMYGKKVNQESTNARVDVLKRDQVASCPNDSSQKYNVTAKNHAQNKELVAEARGTLKDNDKGEHEGTMDLEVQETNSQEDGIQIGEYGKLEQKESKIPNNADLEESNMENSIVTTVTGYAGAFHLATPCIVAPSHDPQKEPLDPTITGTINMLKAVKEAGVSRVVVTSSISSISPSCKWPSDVIKSEECWADIEYCKENQLWYPMSKTLAEKSDWEFSKEKGLEMAVVNPGTVIGPVISPKRNASMIMLLKMGIYLSTPKTEKASDDAHLNLDDSTSFFAVYDGHGGRAVAKFCAKYLHQQVLKNEAYVAGDIGTSLQKSFLRMDEMMRGQRWWRELAVLGDNMEKLSGMLEGLIWSPWGGGEGNDKSDDWTLEEGWHSDFTGPNAGCTACVVVIRGNQLVVANAGDSRCVISRKGQPHNSSKDHKPDLPWRLCITDVQLFPVVSHYHQGVLCLGP